MKRFIFSILTLVTLITCAIFAGEKPTRSVADSTVTVIRCDELKTNLKTNIEALDEKFHNSLTKEQRAILEEQKAMIIQYNTINALADSTVRVKK